MADAAVTVEHPNRRKASSKATRLVVVLLLLASALVLIAISIGAWEAIAGAKALQVGYILLYLALAFFVARWSRGVLPLIAALAIVLLIFALVSVPGWLERDQDGFTQPAITSSVVALLTALIVPLQLLLVGFSLRGFQQAWHVEIARPTDGGRRGEDAPVPA